MLKYDNITYLYKIPKGYKINIKKISKVFQKVAEYVKIYKKRCQIDVKIISKRRPKNVKRCQRCIKRMPKKCRNISK